jgi:hypothetical protein
MNDVNIPAHQSHLQPKDSRVVSVIQENETNSVAIRNPNKTNAEEHMLIFVIAQSLAKPSLRWQWRHISLLQQRLPPNATGCNTAEESVVMKAKSWPA